MKIENQDGEFSSDAYEQQENILSEEYNSLQMSYQADPGKGDPSRKKKHRFVKAAAWICTAIISVSIVVALLILLPQDDPEVEELLEETVSIEIETPPVRETETESENSGQESSKVAAPDIDEQLLTVNDWSRPGEEVDSIDYIVVHYLANPMTTAQQNHDYFESLKDLQDTYMSANFIVGLEGEIIECVPPGEIAYASNWMNSQSISIENCHEDDTGILNEATYQSLIHLIAYLADQYGIDRDHIIRHYDVTGKECPLYYVNNEDKWEELKDDVMAIIEAS